MAVGLLKGLLGSALLTKPLLGSVRGVAAATSVGGYVLGQELVRTQSGKLKAYYGDEAYDKEYARGMNFASGAITVGAGYSFISGIMGKPFLGSTMWGTAKTGLRLGRGIASAPLRAGRALKNYMGEAKLYKQSKQAYAASSKTYAAFTRQPTPVPFIPNSRVSQRNAMIGNMSAANVHASKGAKLKAQMIADEAFANRQRGSGLRQAMAGFNKPADWAINPVNWSPTTLTSAGLGTLAGGVVAGAAYGSSRQRFPLMEAGDIAMAPPSSTRLNYSTAGLTQALHDRRNRRM